MDLSFLQTLPMEAVLKAYKELLNKAEGELYYPMLQELCKQDRFFLLTHALKRVDAIHPWLYARCREVEADPDRCLDLWARFHYKSTIITFAGIIQEILNNPEVTVAIFSYNNIIAQDFVTQIKTEFEINEDLKAAFPDILYENPKKEALLWSVEKGFKVKRKTNPKEATVSGWGLIDSKPVGKHFILRVYDDVVTEKCVTTTGMVNKVTEAWELSLSLGDGRVNRQWYAGTRYSAEDTYQAILDTGFLKPRIYPATDTGTMDGEPVFMEREPWDELLMASSDFTIACQQLLDPLQGSQKEMPDEIMRWEVRPRNLNVYILVDPASGKKSAECNTAFSVVGVDTQMNKYLLDGACHKMDLNARWEMLKKLRNKWVNKPGIQTVEVGYERYSMQADIEHFEYRMKIENIHFVIKEVNYVHGGSNSKNDRIRRLIPDHKNSRFFYPHLDGMTNKMREYVNRGDADLIAKPIKRLNEDRETYELTEWVMKNEYTKFPHTTLKDFLDATSRIYDMDITAPYIYDSQSMEPHDFMNSSPSYYNGQSLEPEADWI